MRVEKINGNHYGVDKIHKNDVVNSQETARLPKQKKVPEKPVVSNNTSVSIGPSSYTITNNISISFNFVDASKIDTRPKVYFMMQDRPWWSYTHNTPLIPRVSAIDFFM